MSVPFGTLEITADSPVGHRKQVRPGMETGFASETSICPVVQQERQPKFHRDWLPLSFGHVVCRGGRHQPNLIGLYAKAESTICSAVMSSSE